MGKKLAYSALALGAFALLVTTSLQAQEGLRDRDRTLSASQEISADLRRARFRGGPFYLLSSLELSDIGYQSAFFVPTSEQGSGISFGLSAPNRLYYVPTKKTVFSVAVTPQYTFFSGGSGNGLSKGQFGYFTRGDAQFLLNHLYLDFFAASDNALVPYTAEINRLVTRRQQTGGLAGELKYSSKTSLTFKADFGRMSFPGNRYQPIDVTVNLLDREDQNYRASLVHKTFPLTSLHVAAERSNYTFAHSPSKDAHRTYLGAGFKFDNGRSGLSAEAGPAKLEFKDPSQKAFSGVLGSAQYRHGGRLWDFSSTVSRDLDFSITPQNNYYVIDRATLLLEYSATRKLKLRFSDSAGFDRYDIATVVPTGELVRRRDTINFVAVGWIYSFRRAQAGFDVGYYKRTSNAEIEEQNGIRGILHLSFTP